MISLKLSALNLAWQVEGIALTAALLLEDT
jgi:hypothetical protein